MVQCPGPERVDLNVDRELLDPKFDGYKLSLDALVSCKTSRLTGKVLLRGQSQSQFSLQHARVWAAHNPLSGGVGEGQGEGGGRRFVLAMDDGTVREVQYDELEDRWSGWRVVARLTEATGEQENAYPATIRILDGSTAVVADGVGGLTVYGTGEGEGEWTPLFSIDLEDDCNGVIVDARKREGQIEVVLHSVQPQSEEGGRGLFSNRLEWITIGQEDASSALSLLRRRRVDASGQVETASLLEETGVLVTVGERAPRLVDDSAGPVPSAVAAASGGKTEKQENSADATAAGDAPVYVWTQQGEEITVTFSLQSGSVDKADIRFATGPRTVMLAVKDCILLGGTLGGAVRPDESTWTMEGEKLEVTLFKADTIAWETLVEGDNRGRYVADPDVVAAMADQLAKFTSDQAALDSSEPCSFNVAQLEECDRVDGEGGEGAMRVWWMQGEGGENGRVADLLGRQVLFCSARPPLLCARHDVDGVVWQLDERGGHHRHTYNALGYVQASKSLRKYTVPASDASYVAIAEARNHVFVYWQPRAVTGDLRNRKSGERVSHAAKQQVISLKRLHDQWDPEGGDDQIHGVHCTPRVLYILTGDSIYAARLK